MFPYINSYRPTEADYLEFWKRVKAKDEGFYFTVAMHNEQDKTGTNVNFVKPIKNVI